MGLLLCCVGEVINKRLEVFACACVVLPAAGKVCLSPLERVAVRSLSCCSRAAGTSHPALTSRLADYLCQVSITCLLCINFVFGMCDFLVFNLHQSNKCSKEIFTDVGYMTLTLVVSEHCYSVWWC